MSELLVDEGLLEAVSARLDLREPNREALETIACEVSQYFDVDGEPPTFEAVVDSATGVGKTYIMAAGIEYLAESRGIRNFAIIAPGRTILNKTVDNFTAGHRRSLLGAMEVDPVLVTADTFASAGTRAAMDDPSRVKLYVFTVQSLIKPKSKRGRKTHEFQEGLGGAFYEHLQNLEDLVVFADEHHCYFGNAFSKAIRDLGPWALLGLTATPHAKSKESVIFRYPLAAAIANRYVKTPVIVGRKDDRTDAETKLLDGVTLLQAKADAAEAYAKENGLPAVNPVMLVVAQSIEEAEEYKQVLESSSFDGGEWAGKVLTVHSDAPDEALEQLDHVEDEGSPVRIIVSVGMLKEGWDVKSVYVIASMRASVSSILTEQTLGRGMRLPWGSYTDVEMLDTLEVLAHERYEQLLKKANVLAEAFIDHRTRASLRVKEDGEKEVVRETEEVKAPVTVGSGDEADGEGAPPSPEGVGEGSATSFGFGARVTDLEKRKEQAKPAAAFMKTYAPRSGAPAIQVPQLQMKRVRVEFSLADITDHDVFRKLGKQLSSDPEGELRRMRVSARVEKGPDGLRRTVLETAPAEDTVESSAPLFTLGDSRKVLEDAVLSSDIVPARNMGREAKALEPILEAFVEGLGEEAERLLSSFQSRAAARLVRLVTDESRRYAPKPKYDEVVQLHRFEKQRETRREESPDRGGRFSKQKGYVGWKKSLYECEWFDSEPERNVANVIDESADVEVWVKLKNGEVPILWRDDGREYNADFIVVETNGAHWVVEVKSDKEAGSQEVAAKREAAKRWVNHVNADEKAEATWHYVLLTETDILDAKGAWSALKGLGS